MKKCHFEETTEQVYICPDLENKDYLPLKIRSDNMNITIDPPSYDNGSINRNLKIIHLDEDEEGLIKSYGDFDYYLKDIDGITYAVIVNCTNIEENFTINAIGNYPTLIGENAFKGNTKIKSLTLGDNIIGIEISNK